MRRTRVVNVTFFTKTGVRESRDTDTRGIAARNISH